MPKDMSADEKLRRLSFLKSEIEKAGADSIDDVESTICQVFKDIFGIGSEYTKKANKIQQGYIVPSSVKLLHGKASQGQYNSEKHKMFMDLIAQAECYMELDMPGRASPNTSSLKDMLAQDILRCTDYLQNPKEETGRNLYTQITARYDSIIKGFGNGLYSYFAEQHFYDPDVDMSTIDHNLNILLQKMITYQAVHYGRDTMSGKDKTVFSNEKVFIVHGHDNEAKTETARVIEKLGLQAIILHEQPSSGNTIIEKIERYSDVGFAVVLYTPCDEGYSKKEPTPRNRARQNVVFEHGYLIGKLGRNRVCALVKDEIETPGDISGVVYVPMDSAGAWRFTLVDEMNAVDFKLNKNDI